MQLRTAAGFKTQQELAAAAGMGAGQLSRLESGRYAQAGRQSKEKLYPVLRARVDFSERWLEHGVGTMLAASSGIAAVEEYLASALAGEVPEPVQKGLRAINWDAIGHPHWSQEAIHIIRRGVEINLLRE